GWMPDGSGAWGCRGPGPRWAAPWSCCEILRPRLTSWQVNISLAGDERPAASAAGDEVQAIGVCEGRRRPLERVQRGHFDLPNTPSTVAADTGLCAVLQHVRRRVQEVRRQGQDRDAHGHARSQVLLPLAHV